MSFFLPQTPSIPQCCSKHNINFICSLMRKIDVPRQRYLLAHLRRLVSRSLGFGHCVRFIGVLGHARTAPIHRTCPVAGFTDCNRVRINGGSICRRRTVVVIPRLPFSVSVHENHVNHIASAVGEVSSVTDSYEEEKLCWRGKRAASAKVTILSTARIYGSRSLVRTCPHGRGSLGIAGISEGHAW